LQQGLYQSTARQVDTLSMKRKQEMGLNVSKQDIFRDAFEQF
jgi:hypothetical protein